MATNGAVKFLYNMITGSTQPLYKPGLFAAGSTKAIKEGELIEKTNTTNTIFVPLDSDFDADGTDDALAVMGAEIKDGDRGGFYPVIVPRPGDVFEAELATAAAVTIGTKLTYSSSTKVTTGGTNPIGYVCGIDNYPYPQGHLTDDASPDAGTTVRSTTHVQFTFEVAASYYKTFEQ
jgi:hypothetical protein